MRVHSSLSVLAAIAAVSLASVAHAQPPRVVEIVGNDQMKYSVTSITAKPGETITVRLKSVGTLPKVAMAHNFVLLAKGTAAEAFAKAAAMAAASGYIPPAMKAQVLALTGLAGNGQTVEVTFKAPKQAGRYDYVCSFPGHFFAGMKGVLTVK